MLQGKSPPDTYPSAIDYYVGNNVGDIFSGITVDVTSGGFSFWTRQPVKVKETIVLIRHTLPFACRKARIKSVESKLIWYQVEAAVVC